MRSLRAACAALALAAVPVALAANPTPRPHYPVRPHPHPYNTPNHPGYPHAGVNHPGARINIDGTVVDRYLNTPSPKPRVTRKPQHTDHRFGQQTFETHATDTNR